MVYPYNIRPGRSVCRRLADYSSQVFYGVIILHGARGGIYCDLHFYSNVVLTTGSVAFKMQ